MSDTNHRRKNKLPVALRHERYHNGYSSPSMHCGDEAAPTKHEIENTDPTKSFQRVGRTRMLDKSLHGWGRKSEFADVNVMAGIGNDFSNGHRGMAKAVKGAKKYVRSRIRAKEKMSVRDISKNEIEAT